MSKSAQPFFQRFSDVKAVFEPLRQAKNGDPKEDKHFNAATDLYYTLKQAAIRLNSLNDEFSKDQLQALCDENDIEAAVRVELLLPAFEKWLDPHNVSVDLKVFVTNLYEFCKNRVLSGDLARLNSTNSVHNLAGTIKYRIYCGIMRDINSAFTNED